MEAWRGERTEGMEKKREGDKRVKWRRVQASYRYLVTTHSTSRNPGVARVDVNYHRDSESRTLNQRLTLVSHQTTE
jgi:hypothetical protein